ncbi:MAG: ATP-binding protein [Phycisphaerae bacterium]|nr:ATP-binding protein [Phycisphaerae bacterium]
MSRSSSIEPDVPLQEMVVESTLSAAKKPEAAILSEVERCGYSEDDIFAIKLSLEEAMTNAVRHGNRCDASKHVTIRYAVTPERTIIIVRDEGPGFCPDRVPDPTAPENIERPSGRGIMLIRAYMTHVEYSATGNEITMVKVNER